MVNALYWVSSLIYGVVLTLILIHDFSSFKSDNKREKAYRLLLIWCIFFCAQDVLWGVCGGSLVNCDALFFAASTIFHLSTVTTTFFWLNYILTYLSDKLKHRVRYLVIDGLVVCLQVVLVIANFFTPTIFTIQDGIYVTEFLRPLAFFNQYIVYFIIAVIAGFYAFSRKDEEKKKYISVFAFAMAPVLTGVFQYSFPDGPYYSMGYFLGCVIIHFFVLLEDRETMKALKVEVERLENEKKMAEQIKRANTDELTGLLNRRAYEDDIRLIGKETLDKNFVYIAADVNGLKVINDSLGHAAGDELIKGAAECLIKCLSEFGKIYRIGGDEFVAIIYVDEDILKYIKYNLSEEIVCWSGNVANELALSIGIAGKYEFTDLPILALAKIADERMYKDKADYYSKRGIDRRGQQTIFSAICASYLKILRVNLTDDTFSVVCMDKDERLEEKGFNLKISEWLYNFGKSGQVLDDDLEGYLRETNIETLRRYFYEGNKSKNIFYRRRIKDEYRKSLMEIIVAEDYSKEHENVYLYVKDIDK